MSSKKPSQNTSNQKGKIPRFITPKEPDGKFVQVMARIPSAEKERFESAQKVLRVHGLDMELSRVIRDALADAAAYVEETYGSQAGADKSAATREEAERVSVSGVEAPADVLDE